MIVSSKLDNAAEAFDSQSNSTQNDSRVFQGIHAAIKHTLVNEIKTEIQIRKGKSQCLIVKRLF